MGQGVWIDVLPTHVGIEMETGGEGSAFPVLPTHVGIEKVPLQAERIQSQFYLHM